jgi:hypothetical protein
MEFGCDQCQMLSINGVACHETGCPNGKKTWIPERGWVLFLKCFNCGCDVEAGEHCDCQDPIDDDDDPEDEPDEDEEEDEVPGEYSAETNQRLDLLRASDPAIYEQITVLQPFQFTESRMRETLDQIDEEDENA